MPARVDKQDLIEDLQRVAEIVDGVPTYKQYEEHGQYSRTPLKRVFGGIVAARETAGISDGPIHGLKVSEDEAIEDLRRVAEEIGRPPSWNEYNQLGEYSAQFLYKKFSGMKEARKVAGIGEGPVRPKRIESGELIADVKRIGKEVGRCPTETEIEDRGKHALRTYIRRFGSWAEVAQRAGFEPNPTTPEGEANHAWKGGNSHNYSSKAWRLARAKALERDEFRCQACGMSNEEHHETFGRAIDVHHIKRVGDFGKPEDAHSLDNLITLCRPHHREYEELPATECKKLKE